MTKKEIKHKKKTQLYKVSVALVDDDEFLVEATCKGEAITKMQTLYLGEILDFDVEPVEEGDERIDGLEVREGRKNR